MNIQTQGMIAAMLARLVLSVLAFCGPVGAATALALSERGVGGDALAQAVCRALPELWPVEPLTDWVDAHRPDVAALITPDLRSAFDQSIAAGHCEAAEAILKVRFRAAFPNLECLMEMEDQGRPSRPWRTFVATRLFPDLDLCFGESKLETLRGIFADRGLTPPISRFRRSAEERSAFGDLEQQVIELDYAAIQVISGCLEYLYQPSCVAYARLATEGVIGDRDETILFYLVRARLAGYDPPERAPLEAEIAARLDAETRAEVEARARKSLTGDWGVPIAGE